MTRTPRTAAAAAARAGAGCACTARVWSAARARVSVVIARAWTGRRMRITAVGAASGVPVGSAIMVPVTTVLRERRGASPSAVGEATAPICAPTRPTAEAVRMCAPRAYAQLQSAVPRGSPGATAAAWTSHRIPITATGAATHARTAPAWAGRASVQSARRCARTKQLEHPTAPI